MGGWLASPSYVTAPGIDGASRRCRRVGMNRSRVATMTLVGTSTRLIHVPESNLPTSSSAAKIDQALVLRNSDIAHGATRSAAFDNPAGWSLSADATLSMPVRARSPHRLIAAAVTEN